MVPVECLMGAMLVLLLAGMALASGGLYFGHYERADHYASPFDVFFRVAFAFSCAMGIIRSLPSLSGGS